MSHEVSPTHEENRATFLSRINALPHSNQEFVMRAYDIAKASHRSQMREGGARYFEHPRSVALILIDECQLLDQNIIAAALLHDAQEDSSIFGSYSGRDYQSWNAVAYDRIKRIFNDEVAEIVTTLTKPPHEIPDVGTKENALNIYYENLYNASDNAILVKMADRLHNLRTLEDTSEEKQERKVQETEEHYLPLFQLVSIRNREARHMLGLINKQLTSLKSH